MPRDGLTPEILFPHGKGASLTLGRILTGARVLPLGGLTGWGWECVGHRQSVLTQSRILVPDILPLGVRGRPRESFPLGRREGGRGRRVFSEVWGSQSWRLSPAWGATSPAQRRLRGPGGHRRSHLFGRPATQFPRFLHQLHDSAAAAASHILSSVAPASDVKHAPALASSVAGQSPPGSSRLRASAELSCFSLLRAGSHWTWRNSGSLVFRVLLLTTSCPLKDRQSLMPALIFLTKWDFHLRKTTRREDAELGAQITGTGCPRSE